MFMKFLSYLFTFCPPGPELRLKFTSQIDFGMVSASKLESHLRAAAMSCSLGAVVWEEAKERLNSGDERNVGCR